MDLLSCFKSSKPATFPPETGIKHYSSWDYGMPLSQLFTDGNFKDLTQSQKRDFLCFLIEVLKMDAQGDYCSFSFRKEQSVDTKHLFPLEFISLGRCPKKSHFNLGDVCILTVPCQFSRVGATSQFFGRKEFYRDFCSADRISAYYFPEINLAILEEDTKQPSLRTTNKFPFFAKVVEISFKEYFGNIFVSKNAEYWEYRVDNNVLNRLPVLDMRFALMYEFLRAVNGGSCYFENVVNNIFKKVSN